MYIRTRLEIGLIIRNLRKEKGFTQEELATRLGRTRRWMMQVELGQTNADISTVLRALRILGAGVLIEPLPEVPPNPDIEAVLRRAHGRYAPSG